jgi:hypothetical protein
MERKEIIVPKGIRYIGEWKEFNLDIDDKPYILNKVLTGCGFTEYCLTNPEDIILVSPRRFLLENKEEQHSKEVYYFRNDNETSTDFELDVSKDDIKAIHEKAEDISEERKVIENLDNLFISKGHPHTNGGTSPSLAHSVENYEMWVTIKFEPKRSLT